MRATPLKVALLTSDLANMGGLIDITIHSRAGSVITPSTLTRTLAANGIVRIDLEPVVRSIRNRRGIEVNSDASERQRCAIEFPCIYAFQDWLEANPSILVTVDSKRVAEMDLLTMRTYMVGA